MLPDHEYHHAREQQHRAMAKAAGGEARRAHTDMADHHASKRRASDPPNVSAALGSTAEDA